MVLKSIDMLQLIKILVKDGNLKLLVSDNISYNSISNSIDILEKQLYIEFDNDKYQLTDKGAAYVKEIVKKHNLQGLDKEIFALNYYRIDKIGVNEIYLSKNRN